jgi:hypothetical protein
LLPPKFISFHVTSGQLRPMQQCDPPGLDAWDLFTWPDLIKKRYYEQRVN